MKLSVCVVVVTCLTHVKVCFNDLNFCKITDERKDQILQHCHQDPVKNEPLYVS